MSKKGRQAKGTKVTTPAATGLPEGWTVAPLHAVTQDVQSINPVRQPTRTWRYADIGGVDSARNVVAEVRTFLGKDAPSRARRPVESGDVLFSNVRVNLRRIAAISDPAPVDVCSTGFTLLRSNGAIDPRFLLHSTLRSEFIEEVADTQTGTQYPATSDRHVRGVSVLIPPLAEQQRIAEKLTELASRLASLRAQLQLAPSLVHYASMSAILTGCTGQLTTAWRSAHNSTSDPAHAVSRVWDQRRATLAKKRHRFHPRFVDPSLPDVEDLPELPDLPIGWLWTSVGFAASRIQYGSSARSDASASNGIPNLGMQNIQSGRIDLAGMKYIQRGSDDIPDLLLQQGDLLFNRTNSPELVGKAAVFSESMNAIFASYLVRVQFQSELAIPQFVCHWINSPWGRMWAEKVKSDGVSQSNISSTKLAEMPLPLPPLEEQRAICNILDRVLSLLRSVAARAGHGLSQAEAIMKSCSQMAFSGLLVEAEAAIAAANGTAYESGEQLLARIRSQSVPTARTREVAYEVSDVSLPRVLIMKKLHEIGKTHLFDLLVKRKKGMTPQELLLASELDVDDFYTQLKREVEAKKVRETRNGKTDIVLEAAR